MLMLLALAIACAVGAYGYHAARPAAGTQAKPVPPVPVTVASAALGELPIVLEVVGRAEAYESVTLMSRIDGQVASVRYREGQQVRQGELLILLDAGDFEARARQAQANLARNEALLARARTDVERYVALQARGFVSEEKVNELRTTAAAAAASVKADQAALELARRQLSYTTIRAPFTGVVGARLVFPGSAVKLNETVLAVVNRVQPLYVTFSVAEKYLPRLRSAMRRGDLHARITIPGDSDPGQSLAATIGFIDNAVDATTGTIQLKALLENREQQLTPGQFLDVSISLDTLTHAVVVPAEAVQQGPDGTFLFVVRPDDTVDIRQIEVQATYRGLAAIASGLAADETIVVDGQLRLTAGAPILVKSRRPPAAVKAIDGAAALSPPVAGPAR
jgi:multidrug efflux system membrane fusion protein